MFLGFLPYVLADAPDVWFSLVAYRAALPIRLGSIWWLSYGTPVMPLAQRADTVCVLAALIGLSGVVSYKRKVSAVDNERVLYGALMLAAACFPLLAKTVWPTTS